MNSNRNVPVAALPVTQQMTEMSISREDKITTPKTEVSEPGMLFKFNTSSVLNFKVWERIELVMGFAPFIEGPKRKGYTFQTKQISSIKK